MRNVTNDVQHGRTSHTQEPNHEVDLKVMQAKTRMALLGAGLALLGTPIVGNAATVTYDFTGIVTGGVGYDLTSGSSVTGTFTFNLDNATSSTGSPSGGNFFFTGPNVFSTTVYSGSTLLYTSLPGSTAYPSFVEANLGSYSAQESAYNSTLTYSASSTFLPQNPGGAGTAWYLNGLPVPGSGPIGSNSYYAVGSVGQTFYNGPATNNPVEIIAEDTLVFGITSLSVQPVPLPPAAWLLVSGLGGLGALARKKRYT